MSTMMELAEAGVPQGSMLDIMEHVSTAMLGRYSPVERNLAGELSNVAPQFPTVSEPANEKSAVIH